MIFFDTETTGLIKNLALHLNKQPHIIEIGCIKHPKIKGQRSNFSSVINPGIKLPEIITKITGLTDEDVEATPTFQAILQDLTGFFKGEDILVAHNMPFDRNMLLFELRRAGVEETFPMPKKLIDTVQLARPLYGGDFKKLNWLYENLIGPVKQTHRALDDAQMLLDVYLALMEKLNG